MLAETLAPLLSATHPIPALPPHRSHPTGSAYMRPRRHSCTVPIGRHPTTGAGVYAGELLESRVEEWKRGRGEEWKSGSPTLGRSFYKPHRGVGVHGYERLIITAEGNSRPRLRSDSGRLRKRPS